MRRTGKENDICMANKMAIMATTVRHDMAINMGVYAKNWKRKCQTSEFKNVLLTNIESLKINPI